MVYNALESCTSSSSANKNNKSKHQTITMQENLKIIYFLLKYARRNFIIRQFNIASSTVSINKLQKISFGSETGNNTFNVLCTLFSAKESEGNLVTALMIIEKGYTVSL